MWGPFEVMRGHAGRRSGLEGRPAREQVAARLLGLAALAVAVTAGATAIAGLPASSRTEPVLAPEPVAAPASVLAAPATTPASSPPAPPASAPAYTVPTSTELATPLGTIPVYAAPGGAQAGTVGTWYHYPLTLPVVASQGEWLDVRLPTRPNGSTAWVLANAVSTSVTPYALVVDLSKRHLMVYRSGAQIMDFPAGIGVAATPTVTGEYFVAVHEAHSEPGYGPLILDTSAHSDAIQSWEGSGDAIIAIHGPITAGADAEIGTTGARVSHGCIRLHDADLAQLAVLPVGTPIDIVG
ncbi:L,D-transpeptidase [Acidiferrimicrobium sp. IK]|uniref:L,D-transpeptidase n=1 Tax=Acidiferrimicrobium sp. IK TaxID=2871700 RepID=UPI0021CAF35E|nr:L,D-transpeptidase [Acidiferrimicrobium sp. IK]MCU4186160.1 L,D-transpeptidase [Acidiferrimicrobium sp. IK]